MVENPLTGTGRRLVAHRRELGGTLSPLPTGSLPVSPRSSFLLVLLELGLISLALGSVR